MSDRAIYVFDFETDPFKWERTPTVFAVGIFNGSVYEYHWGAQDECVQFLMDCMEAAPWGSIWYAHNGGKFDFHFFKDKIRGKVDIIGARIVRCKVGHIELRDSFSLLPFPLKVFPYMENGKIIDEKGKLEIDYAKLELDQREKHKDEILTYMKRDCLVLHQAVMAFIEEFGMSLTAAGAAMKEFRKFHEYERLTAKPKDELFREYFYGGRVECFEKGVLKGNFKVYDVNSMYPSVMRNFEHPVSRDYITYSGKHATNSLEFCDFATVEADNFGALPSRGKNGLSFDQEFGIFKATGHEIRAGVETGRLRIRKVLASYRATEHMKFDTFIDHYFVKRLQAKKDGDKLKDLFYKLIPNSSYGKFAQDSSDFRDYELTEEVKTTQPCQDCINLGEPRSCKHKWILEHEFHGSNPPLFIWSRCAIRPEALGRFNVMTAASITGAARAQLMRGLHVADRPVYCDTDSIICERFAGDLDDKRLGAWKTEAEGNKLAIAGKKMYALFDAKGEVVKLASKGVRIEAKEIVKIARGEVVKYRNEAPTFSFTQKTRFIEREIRAT